MSMTDPNARPDMREPDQERLRQLGMKVRSRLDANPAVQKIVDGKAEVWGVGSFFDTDECRQLISIIDSVAEPSVAYGEGASKSVRTSWSGDVDPRDPFIRRLQRRIDKLLGINPKFGETLQGQRYRLGQEFKPHIDWFPPGSADGEIMRLSGGQRSFTTMVFLNRVEGGGETDFPKLDIAIAPRPGTLLVWNNADIDGMPNLWTFHAGNPVTQGVKYVVTRWYRTRSWVNENT